MFGVIGLLIVVTAYSALNLENRADVSLGVYTFRAVPVFLSSLIAFILGAVLVVPMTLRRGGRRATVVSEEAAAADAEPIPAEPEPELPEDPPRLEGALDQPDQPEDAPRRRRRWLLGARAKDQDRDDAGGRDRGDRNTGGGG